MVIYLSKNKGFLKIIYFANGVINAYSSALA